MSDDTPETLSGFYERYPEATWRLGAVLRSIPGIVSAVQDSEGLDYEGARDWLISEHFALKYSVIRGRYDAARSPCFLSYCLSQFVFACRSAADYRRRRTEFKANRGFSMDSRNLETIERAEPHKSLSEHDCQLCRLIGQETERSAAESESRILAALQDLEPLESFVVWNHAAQGRTYDEISRAVGVSPTTIRKIYLGTIARLRRVHAPGVTE